MELVKDFYCPHVATTVFIRILSHGRRRFLPCSEQLLKRHPNWTPCKFFPSAIAYDGSKAQGTTIRIYAIPSGVELWRWVASINGMRAKSSIEFYNADGFNSLVCWSCDG
jgi:hypothetical protein